MSGGRWQVEFVVPAGRRITGVRALRADRSLDFTQEDSVVRCQVPSVADYEVVALT